MKMHSITRLVVIHLLLSVTNYHCYVLKCDDREGYVPAGAIYPVADITVFPGDVLTLYCELNASSLSEKFSTEHIFFETLAANGSKVKIIPEFWERKQDMMTYKMTDLIDDKILVNRPIRKYRNYLCKYMDDGRCSVTSKFVFIDSIYPVADITVFPGDVLTLYCKVNASSVFEKFSTEHIFFETLAANDSKVKIMPEFWKRKQDMMTYKMTELIDDEILVNHPNRKYNNYVCRYKDDEGLCSIGHKFISIDYAPRKPKDGSCKVYNWQNMTCTWDLGVVYRHMNEMNISVEFRDPGSYDGDVEWTVYNHWFACPHKTIENSCLRCVWKENDQRDSYRKDVYIFRIRVTNKSRNITEQIVSDKINTREFVQPEEIKDLKIQANKTQAQLRWKHSNPIEDKRFRIQLMSQWTNFSMVQENFVDGQRVESFMLKNLTAYTSYIVSIDVIPLIGGQEKGFWSDVVEKEFKTLEDVPKSNPKIWTHFFYCITEDCDMVKIYWQPTPIEERHGVLLNYNITVENMIDKSKSKPIVINDMDLTSYELSLNSSNSYKIRLNQRTKVGKPRDDSYIYILNETTRPNFPAVTWVEADDRYVNITWERTPTITWYGVVWCKGSYFYGCYDTIQTDIVQDNITYSVDMIDANGYYDDYVFGVAAINFTKKGIFYSSGISWIKCVYQQNGVPDEPLEVKKLINIKDKDNLHIKWTPYDCKKAKGYVTSYIVKYCTVVEKRCSGEKVEKRLNTTSTTYTIKDVEKEQLYYVWVFAQLHNNLMSPEGDPLEMYAVAPKISTQSEPDKRFIPIVAGIIGVLLMCLIVTAIVIFVRRKCGVKKGEFDIDIPEVKKTSVSSKRSSSDDGYEGSGEETKEVEDPEKPNEESKPLLPKKPPPSRSDSNDSGCKANNGNHGNSGNEDNSAEGSDQTVSAEDVEPYVRQGLKSNETGRVSVQNEIQNSSNTSNFVEIDNDNMTVKFEVSSRNPYTHDNSVDSSKDMSSADSYTRQTVDCSASSILPNVSDTSHENLSNKNGGVDFMPDAHGPIVPRTIDETQQDCSKESLDPYVRTTDDTSYSGRLCNGYVRQSDDNELSDQGNVEYNSGLLTSSGSYYDSSAREDSVGSVDPYVKQDCDTSNPYISNSGGMYTENTTKSSENNNPSDTKKTSENDRTYFRLKPEPPL